MIKNRYTVVAVLVVAVVAFGYGYKIVTDNISDKVSGENQGSFLARQADVIAGLTLSLIHSSEPKAYKQLKMGNGRFVAAVVKLRTACYDSVFSVIHIFRIRQHI